MSITSTQIEALRTNAVEAGDLDMVQVCTAALADGNIEIRTAKGSFTGSVREVCVWQAEMQGAAATIGGLDVDPIDFDADEMRATILALRNAARAECERVITDFDAMAAE